MSDAFEAATQAFERDQAAAASSSQDSNTSDTNRNGIDSHASPAPQDAQAKAEAVAQALIELDKLEKFKYQGQEYTPKDLEKAMMRMKDYTTKSQSLSEERKSLESDANYFKNLSFDLAQVKVNPSLASEFIKIYPEKFHTYLKEVLTSTSTQQNGQTPSQAQSPGPQIDVDTLSRLNKVEKALFEKETESNVQMIESMMTKFSQKYSDALPKVVLASAVEAYNQGMKLDEATWEKFFKESHDEMGALLKTRYGDMVKKQTEANAKAKDVAAGGGTVGRAPQKFKSLKEVSEHMMQDIASKQ